jgi:hypothetical protein
MNEKENDKLLNILKKVHIPEPRPLLKERITTEAKKVWNQTTREIPWQTPIIRLAASAAAAVIIISIANFSNNHALEKWRLVSTQVTKKQSPDIKVIQEMPYSPLVRHLVSVNRKPLITEATALRDYAERLRQVLNEIQQNGGSNEQVPNKGRSCLFPVQPDSD